MQNWLSILVVLFAVITQSLTGFGSGLVSMAFLPGILGVRTAAPLVALITGTMELILLIRFRASFNLKAVWRLAITTLVGLPIGVWALPRFEREDPVAGAGRSDGGLCPLCAV